MSTGGRQEQQVGWHYFGNFARALSVGPVDVVHKITMGETVIFEGPVDRSSADGDGKTVLDTSLGPIRFYWGTDGQAPDDFLAQFFDPLPAFPGICYYVAENISWGENNPNPPNLSFDVERKLDLLPMAAHEEEGDVSPIEALYAFLVDDFAGPGIDPERIDVGSFAAGGQALITEGIWCSPEIDEHHTLREIVAQINMLAGGRMVERDNRIAYLLDRPAAAVIDIGPGEMLEEPRERDSTEPVGETYLTYRDRANKDEESVEGYVDIATQEAVGDDEDEQIEMHWVRRRPVARRLVSRLGVLASRGRRGYVLDILPPSSAVGPGDRVSVDFPRWGWSGRVHVVESVDRRVGRWELMTLDDTAVDTDTLAAIDPPEVDFEDFEEDLTAPVLRMFLAPTLWYGRGAIFAVQKTIPQIERVKIQARAGGITYDLVTGQTFPAMVEVLSAKRLPVEYEEAIFEPEEGDDEFSPLADELNIWVFRIRTSSLVDRQYVTRILDALDGSEDAQVFLLARRLLEGATPHPSTQLTAMVCPVQLERIWPVAQDVWDIGVIAGADEDGPQFRLPADGESGVFLGTLGWLGRRTDFPRWNHDMFFGGPPTTQTTRFWATVFSRGQSSREVEPQTFRSWVPDTYLHQSNDPLAVPVDGLYEIADTELGKLLAGEEADESLIAGIDDALGALFDGSDEADDLFFLDVDRALGAFYETGFYDPEEADE